MKIFVISSANAFTLTELNEVIEHGAGDDTQECAKNAV